MADVSSAAFTLSTRILGTPVSTRSNVRRRAVRAADGEALHGAGGACDGADLQPRLLVTLDFVAAGWTPGSADGHNVASDLGILTVITLRGRQWKCMQRTIPLDPTSQSRPFS